MLKANLLLYAYVAIMLFSFLQVRKFWFMQHVLDLSTFLDGGGDFSTLIRET